MAPGVAGHLVALPDHAAQDARPRQALVVDPALAEVDASDEERRRHRVGLQDVQELRSVDVRPIVVGEGKGACLGALRVAAATVGNAAKARPGHCRGACSGRGRVRVTGRAIFEQAVGRIAIGPAHTAHALQLPLADEDPV